MKTSESQGSARSALLCTVAWPCIKSHDSWQSERGKQDLNFSFSKLTNGSVKTTALTTFWQRVEIDLISRIIYSACVSACVRVLLADWSAAPGLRCSPVEDTKWRSTTTSQDWRPAPSRRSREHLVKRHTWFHTWQNSPSFPFTGRMEVDTCYHVSVPDLCQKAVLSCSVIACTLLTLSPSAGTHGRSHALSVDC